MAMLVYRSVSLANFNLEAVQNGGFLSQKKGRRNRPHFFFGGEINAMTSGRLHIKVNLGGVFS